VEQLEASAQLAGWECQALGRSLTLGRHGPCRGHTEGRAYPPRRQPCTLGTLVSASGCAAICKGMASRRGGHRALQSAPVAAQSICCTRNYPRHQRHCCCRLSIARHLPPYWVLSELILAAMDENCHNCQKHKVYALQQGSDYNF
jgi:hypothetical protein